MIYLDSSYIVKCYLDEAGSREVLSLVQRNRGRLSAVHGRAEFFAAVHRRLRERHLTANNAAAVWRQFTGDELAGLWEWLPLTDSVVHRACRTFEHLERSIFLRGADALHLACAAEHGFAEVYSADRVLLGAAPHFGVRGINVY